MPAAPASTTIALADGRRYERIPIETPWITAGTEIPDLVARACASRIRSGDIVVVSEKPIAIALRTAIPASALRPGALARALSRAVGETQASGLDVPEKMQLVVRRCGILRVLLAAAAAAITKPLGISGAFYRIVGEWSKDIDGMTPPYPDLVIPPLDEAEANRICARISTAVGSPAAIVDINDRGGRIRAASAGLDRGLLLDALRDNPLGQRTQGTPIGLLRPLAAG